LLKEEATKNMKKFTLLLIPLFVFLLSFTGARAFSVDTPIISDFNPGLKSFSEPFVSGITSENTSVLVYIDGIYYDDAKIVNNAKLDNFYVYLKNKLSEGKHSFFLISRDMNGVMSPQSKEKDFIFTDQIDTPVITKTNFNSSVYISGKSANENFIDLYIDNNLFKTFFIDRNSKNTFQFDFNNLTKGNHSFFIIARDDIGRRSNQTKEFSFFFNKPTSTKSNVVINPVVNLSNPTSEKLQVNQNIKKPSISEEGQIEEVVVEGVDNIENIDQNKPEELNNETNEVDKILKNISEEENKNTGSLDEEGQNQSDLKINLIIFLGFLIAVILWIVWVNREISSEGEKEEKTKE